MDVIFNSHKVKFTVLDSLISDVIGNINEYSKVNIYINLENVINKLANIRVDEYLRVKEPADRAFEFISNIINLASHYRLYFSKNKIFSNIYFYIPYPFDARLKNRSILEKYRSSYEYRFSGNSANYILFSLIHEALPLTMIILEYISGVYCITSSNIEASLIPYVISRKYDHLSSDHNIILSNNSYDLQYVNLGFSVLRPKGSMSKLITSNNIMTDVFNTNDFLKLAEISSAQLPFILSLIGNPQRDIPSIKGYGIKKILRFINQAILAKTINPDTNNIGVLINLIKEEFRDDVLKNYYCTDIVTQYNSLGDKDFHDILSQIKDKYDNDTLKKLNDEYFVNHPINLMEVTSVPMKKKNVIF